MSPLARHEMGALLLGALRRRGLGVRELFEGRQEPLSWFFRAVAYDQAELDIMESGAVERMHVPSALVELMIDEMALGLTNIGLDGLATYLVEPPPPGTSEGEPFAADGFEFDPGVMLGFLTVDVAPPALWLEERESNPVTNEHLAVRLTGMAQEVGAESDAVEVHIEGALDAEGGWTGSGDRVRPAGVSVHFTLDIPLVGTGERTLARIFDRGAGIGATMLEAMRGVFRADES